MDECRKQTTTSAHRVFGAWLVAGVCVMIAPLGAAAQAPVTYDVLINGETFSVTEGDTTRLRSAKDSTVQYVVSVRPKRLQQYTTDRHIFTYPSVFALADNFANPGRSIKLTHPEGISIVITQLSPYRSEFRRDEAMAKIVGELGTAFRARNPSGLRIGDPSTVKFENAAGTMSQISSRDARQVEQICDVYVLQDGTWIFSVVVQYIDRARGGEVAVFVKPLIDSFKKVPLPEHDPDDHTGHTHD